MERIVTLLKAPNNINTDLMTVDEIRAMLQEGYEDIIADRVQDASVAFSKFREKHQYTQSTISNLMEKTICQE